MLEKRTALLISVVIITSVTSRAQKIQNATKYNIMPFVRCCCADLEIENCLILIKDGNLKERFGLQGQTSEIDRGHSYNIMIDKNCDFESARRIIAHELVHIMQLKSGILRFNRDSIYYYSDSYSNKQKTHNYHAHEIEAVRAGDKLFEKFRNVLVEEE